MIDPTFMRDAMPVTLTADPAERCQYPSKICRNRRTVKRNGELHRFCEEHRVKANKNQKRWIKNNQHKNPTNVAKDRKPTRSTAIASPASSQSSSTPHTPVDAHWHEPKQESPESPESSEPLTPEYATPPSFTALLYPLSYWEPDAETSYEQLTKEFVQDWRWPVPAVEFPVVGRLEYDLYEHEIEPMTIQL